MKITDDQFEKMWMLWCFNPSGDRESLRLAIESLPDPTPEPPALRPVSEMPEKVPEGCVRRFGFLQSKGGWAIGDVPDLRDTHFIDIRLPVPVDTEREEFEAAMRAEWPDTSFTLIEGSNSYFQEETESAWTLWKLARATPKP